MKKFVRIPFDEGRGARDEGGAVAPPLLPLHTPLNTFMCLIDKFAFKVSYE